MKALIDAVWLWLGKKIKPYAGTLLAIVSLVIALWSFAQDSLFDFLCKLSETVPFLGGMCSIGESKFYALMLGVMGTLITLREKLEKLNKPAELRIGGVEAPAFIWIAAALALAFLILAGINIFPGFASILIILIVIGGLWWILNKIFSRS